MATTIAPYLQARNLVSLNVSGANPDAEGDLTWSSAVNLAVGGVATFEAFNFQFVDNGVQIKPADSTIDNMVPEYDSINATVSEIAPSNGTGNLAALVMLYDYIRVEALYRPRGAATGGTYVVVIGKRGQFNKGFVQGKNVDSLTLETAGVRPYIGSAAPTI